MILAVDTETTGTDFWHGCRPFMITACDGEFDYIWEGVVDPFTREVTWNENDLDEIQILLNKTDILVFHNAKFDMFALEFIGIKINHLWNKTHDTLIMSHCIRSGANDKSNKKVGRTRKLKDLAIEYFDFWDDDEKELQQAVVQARERGKSAGYDVAKFGHPHFPAAAKNAKFVNMDYWLAIEDCRKYGSKDAQRTWLLYKAFEFAIRREGLWYVYQKRTKLLEICYKMQKYGMHFDSEKALKFKTGLENKMKKLIQSIRHIAQIPYAFVPTKPSHLIDLLHRRLKIPVMFTTDNGTPQVNKIALKHYEKEFSEYECIALLRKWRNTSTIHRYLTSYIKWVADDHLHGTIMITGTRETRQASLDPNLQNFPKDLKRLFVVPKKGRMWASFDLRNIELCLWAYMVGSEDLVKCFQEDKSVHLLIFEIVYPDYIEKLPSMYPELHRKYGLYEAIKNLDEVNDKTYTNCKSGTFSIIYGATEQKTDDTYGRIGARKKIEERLPEVKAFIESCHKEVYDNHDNIQQACIHTTGGYRLDVPLAEPHTSCNYKVQGSAGYLMNLIMIDVDTYLVSHPHLDGHMIGQVHDELSIDFPDTTSTEILEDVKYIMEKAGRNLFPPYRAEYKVKIG